LSDGPPLGLPPNRFDADASSIRIVRVTITLDAAADDSVPDFEITFDVAPRNLRKAP
jgi:hypothetical protein